MCICFGSDRKRWHIKCYAIFCFKQRCCIVCMTKGCGIFLWLYKINDCNMTILKLAKLCFGAISSHQTTSSFSSSALKKIAVCVSYKPHSYYPSIRSMMIPSACIECPQIIREAAARCGPNWMKYLSSKSFCLMHVFCTFYVGFFLGGGVCMWLRFCTVERRHHLNAKNGCYKGDLTQWQGKLYKQCWYLDIQALTSSLPIMRQREEQNWEWGVTVV